ncbi:MAG: DNA polymerase IV [Planctomycetota bacterium]
MGHSRIIIHVDMDAFFAAIEQRDNPAYKGQPVVIGASPEGGRGRGVVSTCSYEAREYGIHSAQPISQAYKRCPHAVFLPVDGQKYARVSREIKEILHEFTPRLEPISIDEAFLDVTDTMHLFGGNPETTAQQIKERIYKRTELRASLGVAPNKMLAKIASDLEKPDGMVIVEPGEVQSFLNPLPVGTLWGVGEKTEHSLSQLGITAIGDLAEVSVDVLESRMGKQGRHLWRLAHGIDNRPVENEDTIKSVGHEHTFKEDTDDADLLAGTLMQLCEKVSRRLRNHDLHGRTITTKVRLADFSTYTRSVTIDHAVRTSPELYDHALANFDRVRRCGKKIRLLGVTVSNLIERIQRQVGLFSQQNGGCSPRKMERLERTVDAIKDRFGDDALHQGTSLRGMKNQECEARRMSS